MSSGKGDEMNQEIGKRAAEFRSWADWPHEFLTAEELGSILRVPRAWVWAAAREGRIPSYRCGHYVRFSLEEVLAVIKRTGIPASES